MSYATGSLAEAIALRTPVPLRLVQGELIHAAWCMVNQVGADHSIDLNVLLNVLHYLGVPTDGDDAAPQQ